MSHEGEPIIQEPTQVMSASTTLVVETVPGTPKLATVEEAQELSQPYFNALQESLVASFGEEAGNVVFDSHIKQQREITEGAEAGLSRLSYVRLARKTP